MAEAITRIGLKEHIIFPEIDYDKVEDVLGMDIIVCTTAPTDDEARALLAGFEFSVSQLGRAASSATGGREWQRRA